MGLSNELQDRLARVGLVEIEQAEPEPAAPTLGAFIDTWKAGRQDVKPTSQLVYGRCRKWLVACFGEDRPIDSITEGDADEWAAFLRSKLGENTARKMTSVAKQVFKHAVRKRLIESNSFTDLSAAVRASDDRSQFVSRAEIDKAIVAAPDVEWELIIALARYGGLRMPSELFPLKWRDINLAAGATVHYQSEDGTSRKRGLPSVPDLPGTAKVLRTKVAKRGHSTLRRRLRSIRVFQCHAHQEHHEVGLFTMS